MIHLLSSDLEIQTYMINVHLACKNYQKLQVQLLWHEIMSMDYTRDIQKVNSDGLLRKKQ
jgi:hypothetical protein